MTDNIISYETEIEVHIKNDVYFRKRKDVWSVGYYDEDEIILEDSENKIFFMEEIEYYDVLITPELFEEAKELVKEGSERNE